MIDRRIGDACACVRRGPGAWPSCPVAERRRPAKPDYPIQPVPFTAVHLNDVFWAPRIEINRTVQHPLRVRAVRADRPRRRCSSAPPRCSAARRNVDKRPPGYPFDDTDLYKVIEGASYSLSVVARSEARRLRRRPDREDRRGAGARRLHLHDADDRSEEPASLGRPERWVFERDDSHELYDLGHLFEAAVAHHLATGKRTLLDVAIKAADLLVSDVRSRQADDVARPSDHRDGAGEAVSRHRQGAVSRPREVPARRARARAVPAGRAREPARPQLQPGAPEGDRAERAGRATRCARSTCTPAWPTSPRVTGDEAMRAAGKRIWDYLITSKLYSPAASARRAAARRSASRTSCRT